MEEALIYIVFILGIVIAILIGIIRNLVKQLDIVQTDYRELITEFEDLKQSYISLNAEIDQLEIEIENKEDDAVTLPGLQEPQKEVR